MNMLTPLRRPRARRLLAIWSARSTSGVLAVSASRGPRSLAAETMSASHARKTRPLQAKHPPSTSRTSSPSLPVTVRGPGNSPKRCTSAVRGRPSSSTTRLRSIKRTSLPTAAWIPRTSTTLSSISLALLRALPLGGKRKGSSISTAKISDLFDVLTARCAERGRLSSGGGPARDPRLAMAESQPT